MNPEQNIYLTESHLNKSENYSMGESLTYESSFDSTDGIKYIFGQLQKEFGRCVSKVFVDTKTGTQQIGWVFEKQDEYEDTKKPFIHETWVSLHTQEPERHTSWTQHYFKFQ